VPTEEIRVFAHELSLPLQKMIENYDLSHLT